MCVSVASALPTHPAFAASLIPINATNFCLREPCRQSDNVHSNLSLYLHSGSAGLCHHIWDTPSHTDHARPCLCEMQSPFLEKPFQPPSEVYRSTVAVLTASHRTAFATPQSQACS